MNEGQKVELEPKTAPQYGSIRVALLQLTSHPFVTVDGTDYSAEPFRPSNANDKGCLGRLLAHSLDACTLRDSLRKDYEVWHWERLHRALEWLFDEERNWPDGRAPEIVVLPEFSHCATRVNDLVALAKLHRFAFCAGSHGFETNERFKSSVSEPSSEIARNYRGQSADEQSAGTKSVIVEIDADGNLRQRLKWRLSPFEYTEAKTSDESRPDMPRPRKLLLRNNRQINVLTLVCSEALQHLPSAFAEHRSGNVLNAQNSADKAIDLVVIPSYDFNPKSFEPILQHYTRNKVPVIYCNDGTAGGSCVNVIVDKRMTRWFWGAPNDGKLAPGDSILVCDVMPGAAIDREAANPRQTHALVKLSSVVPADSTDDTFRVANTLNQLREKRRTAANEESSLLSLLDSANPNQLQQNKIRHLLVQYGRSDSPDWWNALADDCVIDKMPLGYSAAVALEKVEREFASRCYDWIRSKLESEGDKPAFGAELLSVRELCRSRFANNKADNPLGAVKIYTEQVAKEAREECIFRLQEMLAILVERVSATSGWVFLLEESSRLVARIAHNTVFEQIFLQSLDDNKPSIVKHVFREGRGYFSNNVAADPHYCRTIATTRSELCIPLYAQTGYKTGSIIGVLNLESREYDAFLPCHVGEMQSAASQLVPDLLLLREHFIASGRTCWHPQRHKWGARRILDGFSRAIATSLLPLRTQEALSCTAWYHDIKKEVLVVLGTVRLDYEYCALRLLPEDSWTGGVSKAGREHKAVPVTIDYANRNGSYSQKGDPRRFLFSRSIKAGTMEVERILSVPAYQKDATQAFGVLNLYFFERERAIYGDVLVKQFTETDVARLADYYSRLFAGVVELRKLYAWTQLRAILAERSIPFVTDCVNVRRFLCECFEGDGLTMFGSTSDGRKHHLIPLTTTGLTTDGKPAGPELKYEVRRQVDEERGFTQYLANNIGATYRRHDVADPYEKVEVGQPKTPSNLHPEDFAPTEQDHRRFLGASFGSDDTLLGIVRVIRKPTDPFFLPEDEEMLSGMGLNLVPLLEQAVAFKRRESTLWGEEFLKRELLRKQTSRQNSDRTGGQRCARLIHKLCICGEGPFGWNRKLVDTVLQTAIALADEITKNGIVLANIRLLYPSAEFAARGVPQAMSLRLYAFHSKLSGQPPFEGEGLPVVSRNIGRGAIDLNAPVYFVKNHCPNLFHPIHRDSERVASGIVFPFSFSSSAGLPRGKSERISGVLSIDANRLLSDDEQRMIAAIAHVTSGILNFLGRDNAPAGRRREVPPKPLGNICYEKMSLSREEWRRCFPEESKRSGITKWKRKNLIS